MTYSYNPHKHFKIWLSKNPAVFMNFENQIRIIEMRVKNPTDTIHFVYDTTLLNNNARKEALDFCTKHNFIPVDVNEVITPLTLTANEQKLFNYYKDEIEHLDEGGNLGVASDILRWISSVYRLGKTYTDYDVPVDTSNLPETIDVESPILLNIGSLKIGSNELVLSNNDYISIVDETAGKEQIEQIQKGILGILEKFSTDFVQESTKKLGGKGFLNSRISSYMKNRAESEYIEKSQQINQEKKLSSRALRAFVQQVTSDKNEFLNFNAIEPNEPHQKVIKRLKTNLAKQLSPVKWLFFNKEYQDIQTVLTQNDEKFLQYLMKKEQSLYIESIVICTTGPLVLAKSLFGSYVLNSSEFSAKATPMSFNHYDLQTAFQSQNSIPLHETVLGMLRFLGTADGERNDSSWLEKGLELQKIREAKLIERKEQLTQELPYLLYETKYAIHNHIKKLRGELTGPFSFFRRAEQRAQLDTLVEILTCFDENTQTFDLSKLRRMLLTFKKTKRFVGRKFSETEGIINTLECLCTEAQVLLGAKENDPIMFKARHAFSIQEEEHYFTLNRPRMRWDEVAAFVLLSPFLLIRWFFSFLLNPFISHLTLAPTQVKKQRPVHYVSMSDDPDLKEDDLVVINLIPHESHKILKDLVLKLTDFIGLPLPESMKKRKLYLNNVKGKQQIDSAIDEMKKLIKGTSKSKGCEGKLFTWDKIHFKGMELLDAPLYSYFLGQLKEQFGPDAAAIRRTHNLNFFTLDTNDGAVLDSLAFAAEGEEAKPMSERKFVINCLPRDQNYIKWIKDSGYSAQKIGCTVIAFNYRGIDYSKGMIWTQDNPVNDAVAQVERLLALGALAKNIGLEGDCIGASIATLAAAKLHQRHYAVKLYNFRSFRSLPRFLEGYFMPESSSKDSWFNPMNYLKYGAVGIVRYVLTPFIWITGWPLYASSAWDEIPWADKDYGVIRNDVNAQHRTFAQSDGCIHDSWASIASHLDEQMKDIQEKKKRGVTLTPEEQAIFSDESGRHCFRPSQKPQVNEATPQKINPYCPLSHFLPRRNLDSSSGAPGTSHDYMVKFFKNSFSRTTESSQDNMTDTPCNGV